MANYIQEYQQKVQYEKECLEQCYNKIVNFVLFHKAEIDKSIKENKTHNGKWINGRYRPYVSYVFDLPNDLYKLQDGMRFLPSHLTNILLHPNLKFLINKLKEISDEIIPFIYHYSSYEDLHNFLPTGHTDFMLPNYRMVEREDNFYEKERSDKDITSIRVTNSKKKARAELEEGYLYYVENNSLLKIPRPHKECYAIVLLNQSLERLRDFIMINHMDDLFDELNVVDRKSNITLTIPYESWSKCSEFLKNFESNIHDWEIKYLELELRKEFRSYYYNDKWLNGNSPYDLSFKIKFFEYSKKITIQYIEFGELYIEEYDIGDRYDISDM